MRGPNWHLKRVDGPRQRQQLFAFHFVMFDHGKKYRAVYKYSPVRSEGIDKSMDRTRVAKDFPGKFDNSVPAESRTITIFETNDEIIVSKKEAQPGRRKAGCNKAIFGDLDTLDPDWCKKLHTTDGRIVQPTVLAGLHVWV